MPAKKPEKKKSRGNTGRPFVSVRMDPQRLRDLAATAEVYGVSVAEIARAFIEIEQDAPRMGEIRERLRVYDRQVLLPLTGRASRGPPRGGEGGRHARPS